jgi:serine protein kinase
MSKAKEKNSNILTLDAYLKQIKTDPTVLRTPAERMLAAIGEPEVVDTSKDPKLSRLFGNRTIKKYAAFDDFYGLEAVIEKIVAYFTHAAQGLEEANQILYLLGPVGSAKSSLLARLKDLMEKETIYVLADENGKPSPVWESPLGLFSEKDGLGIPRRYLKIRPSPWALKRLDEYDGDKSRFKVLVTRPSLDRQRAITEIEPGDENNQDISVLTGKLNIREIEFRNADDPDAYNYCGGLCRANQGMLEFVEMFKAPIKVLNPLLSATQEHKYKGTEQIGAIPFEGIIVAHSNESEWAKFKNDKHNEAFLDRIYIVEVPYCLRVDEELKIYQKLIRESSLDTAKCAPNTLELLAQFCVLSRLEPVDGASIYTKLKVYNGLNMKERDAHAKTLQEYKDLASKDEGFSGVSTRLAFKIISRVYNFDPTEVAADPVHMLYVIEQKLAEERLSQDVEVKYLAYLKEYLAKELAQKIGKDIQTAYLDSYDEYGQALFDRYIMFADHWVSDNNFRDPDTGVIFERAALNSELEKIEKASGIANPKDFRNEIVNFALRYRGTHNGKNPNWKSYEKLREVIEKKLFNKTEDILPVISFEGQGSKEDKSKHEAFIDRMMDMGYTRKQVQRLVEWHLRVSKQ